MIRHVSGIAEIVEDVDAAVRYYRDALGLEVHVHPGGLYADVVVGGVPHFGIWDRRHAAGVIHGDTGAADRVPLGFHVGFEVDDVDADSQALEARGGHVLGPPQTQPWGQRTAPIRLASGTLGELAVTPGRRRLGTPPVVGNDDA